jgi:hypothetical protein
MNHFTVHGSGNLTAPGGHDYPKTMNFHWLNGTDTVNLVFTNPKQEVLLFVQMLPYSEILNICV